jgi:hypothetical protein
MRSTLSMGEGLALKRTSHFEYVHTSLANNLGAFRKNISYNPFYSVEPFLG